MAGSLMLINPKKRRRSHHKRRATARRSNPVAAPRRRRRVHHAKRRHNPIGLSRVHHRRHTRRRRNPIGGAGNIGSMLINGLKGSVGAVAINAVTSFLPAALNTGNVLYVTRAGLALILGTLGRRVGLGHHARAMAEGALAVNFTDLINSFGGAVLPGAQLHGMGAYMSAVEAPGELGFITNRTSSFETQPHLSAYQSADY